MMVIKHDPSQFTDLNRAPSARTVEQDDLSLSALRASQAGYREFTRSKPSSWSPWVVHSRCETCSDRWVRKQPRREKKRDKAHLLLVGISHPRQRHLLVERLYIYIYIYTTHDGRHPLVGWSVPPCAGGFRNVKQRTVGTFWIH
jgi:hypothetical protein